MNDYRISIYDFCKYFDFTCEKQEDGSFVATDDQSVFCNREFRAPGDAVDMFDSMLMDYVDEELEHNGFDFDDNSPLTYYEQACKWCEKEFDHTDVSTMVHALVNPELIIERTV